MLTYDEYKVTDYINDYKDTDITFDKMYLKKVLESSNGKMVINIDSVIDRYSGELDKLKTTYKIGESEKKKYFYNPKALSFKLYGTTELWSLLLYINEMHSAAEFSLESPYVYSQAVIPYLIEILNLETEELATNRTAVNTDLLT